MDMIELPPTPRVLVRVQGGEKRLAVDVVLLDFDDESRCEWRRSVR